jgi:hypothetical protein
MASKWLKTTAFIALVIASSSVLGKEPEGSGARPPTSALPRYSAEEAKALGDAAERRAKARQRQWDSRLNEISGSICNGC